MASNPWCLIYAIVFGSNRIKWFQETTSMTHNDVEKILQILSRLISFSIRFIIDLKNIYYIFLYH